MLTYIQKTGVLKDAADVAIGMGYSGHEEGKNNPALQNIHDKGPIPCGMYTIVTMFTSKEHGPDCLQLLPDKENEMFGRSGFLMHGDSVKHPGMASLGCIIQLHDVRLKVWNSGDRRLRVVAE